MLWAVDALSASWVSVYTHPGGRGGVALMAGYVLDRVALTNEERRQLLAALQSLPERKGGRVLAKLSALFCREQEDWLQVNLSRWGDAEAADSKKFRFLKQAVLGR